jgi:hypothetical protein
VGANIFGTIPWVECQRTSVATRTGDEALIARSSFRRREQALERADKAAVLGPVQHRKDHLRKHALEVVGQGTLEQLGHFLTIVPEEAAAPRTQNQRLVAMHRGDGQDLGPSPGGVQHAGPISREHDLRIGGRRGND